MLSDDDLRRIAADRLLPLVGDRLNTANGEKFIGNMRADWDDMVGRFAAVLREEFNKLQLQDIARRNNRNPVFRRAFPLPGDDVLDSFSVTTDD